MMQCEGSQEGETLKNIHARGCENTVSTATLQQLRREQGQTNAGMGSAATGGLYTAARLCAAVSTGEERSSILHRAIRPAWLTLCSTLPLLS